MKFLPQTDKLLLRLSVIGMSMACIWFAVANLESATTDQYKFAIAALVLWTPLAIGLWLLMPWARFCALILLWILILSIPFAVSVLEAINGGTPPLPIWEQLLYRVVPYIIPAAFFIEILYGYKNEFRRSRVHDIAPDYPASRTALPRSWLLWTAGVIVTPIMLVTLLEFAVHIKGGCISIPPSVGGDQTQVDGISPILPLVCVTFGLFAFLKSAPVEASRLNLFVRALLYVSAMLLFLGNVSGYIEITSLC